jgi:hypothetical protein
MIPVTPGYTRARRLLSLSGVVRDALPVMRGRREHGGAAHCGGCA